MRMGRIDCVECRRCNRKGKPSVTRMSKYCDEHYVKRIQAKKSIFGFLTNIKNKFFDKRVTYDEKGKVKEFKSKGFRKSWFWR